MTAKRTITCLLGWTGLLLYATAAAPADDLPRRGVLGVRLKPLPAEARTEAGLAAGAAGVLIADVVPDSPAERAGLRAGAVLTKVAGEEVRRPAEATVLLARYRAGDTVELTVRRDGQPVVIRATLTAPPREQRDDFDILYDHVVSQGHRLRTIVTRPVGDGRYPAVLFIQGITCSSVENVSLYQKIFYPLTEYGFVTLRVEKPGIGDSEGGPCEACDFQTELDAYRQALRALKRYDFVDPDRVFIFGHSMGGIFGPLLAAEEPVRGVAVFGTGFRTWLEYMLENNRRQALLAGADYPDVDAAIRQETVVSYELLVAKKTPEQIIRDHPDLREYVEAQFPDGEHLYGRHYRFYQQLYDVDLPAAWQKLDGYVLALYGAGDFLTAAEDHRMIADAVNRRHPGRAAYRLLEGIDHVFRKAATPEESFRQLSGQVPPGEFNPVIVEVLRTWLQEKSRAAGESKQP